MTLFHKDIEFLNMEEGIIQYNIVNDLSSQVSPRRSNNVIIPNSSKMIITSTFPPKVQLIIMCIIMMRIFGDEVLVDVCGVGWGGRHEERISIKPVQKL